MREILLVISMVLLFVFGFVIADKGWKFFYNLFEKDEHKIESMMDF